MLAVVRDHPTIEVAVEPKRNLGVSDPTNFERLAPTHRSRAAQSLTAFPPLAAKLMTVIGAKTMLATALVLLALAALGGLVMAVARFKGDGPPPTAIAMAHGVVAVAALTLLTSVAAVSTLPSLAILAIVILTTATTFGVVLNLIYHGNLRALPKPLVIGDGVAAIVGFLLLLLGI